MKWEPDYLIDENEKKGCSYYTCWKKWKEKQLEKELIILYPGVNLGLRRSKEEKTLLNLLSISTTRPLINSYWRFVRKSSNR